jgi:hypothetical protein
MLSIFPRTLLRFLAGAMVEFALLCPTLWGEPSPRHSIVYSGAE